MKENKLTPKTRFKEFMNDEAWEQSKLDDISDVRDGTHDSPQYYSEGHPFITSKNVRDGYINYDDIQYISDTDFELINKRSRVDKNDILMGMIGTIGNIALVREKPDFAIKNVALIKDIKKVHYLYLYHYLQSTNVLNQLSEGMDGGTQKFIALNKIRNLIISVPQNDEQKKIGIFFNHLDNLITLHQRKLKKLKETKSAYLSEMFPKEGEKYPKRRFVGFNDPWEQIKIKDIFPVIRSGNRLPKDSIKKGDIPYVIATVENNGVFMEIDENTLDYHGNDIKLFEAPSITFSIDNPEAIFLQEKPFYTSNIMRVLNNKLLESVDYLFFLETLRKLTGGFDWSIKFSGPIVLNLDIMIPMNKEKNEINFKEVRKIGMFFHNLDNQIEINQKKLEKLENIKKAYLNEMFV